MSSVAILLIAGIAALMTNLLVPLVTRVAVVLEAVDHPGGRRTHDGSKPLLGGVAIGIGAVTGVASVAFTRSLSAGEGKNLAALLLGTGMVFLIGLVDDVTGLSIAKKLLVQTAAAWLIVENGWRFELVGLPGGTVIELGALSTVLTIVWIVGVTNAINLIDGLDGLATGVVAIIAASLLVIAVLLQREPLFTVMLLAAILGACLGFLPYNREPAKIFMGDAGTLPLGFLLATLSIHGSMKSPTTVAILVPVLALGVPVIDTLLVMLVRFMERPKGALLARFLRMFVADRNHLHHLLESLPITRRTAVLWIYLMVTVSCVMALTVALTKQGSLGWVLVLVELIAVFLIRQFGLARSARRLAAKQRERLREELSVDL